LSPAYPEFSVQEFNRCVRDGPMVSIGEIEADKPCSVPENGASCCIKLRKGVDA
jgi:hypothetical protein